MISQTVPMNKQQRRTNQLATEVMSPGTGTKHAVYGVLIEVYDQERLATMKLQPQDQQKLDDNPGLLFAKVRINNGYDYVLPFRDSEDLVYLTYGNSVHLEGRPCRIEYEGISIESGQVIIQRTLMDKHVSIPEVGQAFDIGGIV